MIWQVLFSLSSNFACLLASYDPGLSGLPASAWIGAILKMLLFPNHPISTGVTFQSWIDTHTSPKTKFSTNRDMASDCFKFQTLVWNHLGVADLEITARMLVTDNRLSAIIAFIFHTIGKYVIQRGLSCSSWYIQYIQSPAIQCFAC